MGEFRTVTYEVHNPKIKQNQSVRFAVLADVHGSEFGTDNCDLQAKIRENLPDAILVAGDMVVRKDVSTLENARKLLISLAKDFPVFYGLGNHESKMKIEGYPCQSEYLEYEQSLRKAGVHILTNEKYEFQAKGTSLVINGLELPLEYYHKPTSPKLTDQAMEQLMGKPEPDAVNILLAHSPKYGRTYFNWGADLILMDIEMPGMNGLDAARAVLEQRPECKVIFVTAYSLFQYAHEAMHLGACDYLLKPVNPDEVEASIRKAIRQIEAGRRLAELAPVEPEPEADPESDAAEAGENDRNALVMAHVRKYMEDNYMFDLSLDSVSEILHISPAYLSAQFKKYQKMNFLDCLTELRINAAKELLTDPFRSAAEVASMVGYEDSSYFARTFKKRTGMTPTQYRREAAKAAREARL